MTVDAGDRMSDVRARLLIAHRIDGLEPSSEIAVAETQIGGVHRRVAVQAGSGLLRELLALGELLVRQHVRMTALLAKILAEGIACPEFAEARVLFES